MSRITDYPIYTERDAPTSDNFIIDSLAKGTRRTRDELERMKIQADIEYIAMMTDIEL